MAPKNEVIVKFLGDATGFTKVSSVVDSVANKLGINMKSAGILAGAGVAAGAIAAGKALYDVGEKFDAAYDHIRVSTGKTGPALEGLKNDFKQVVRDVPTDFTSAGNAIAFVQQKMDASGKTGRVLSEQFLELSRITGTDLQGNMQAATDALNVFNIPAKFAPDILNEIFRASQQSGVGFSDLAGQVADAATTLKPLGFTIGETTAFVASLGKAGLSTSDVLPAIGKSLAKAAKEGVPAQKFLAETFAKIKNAPNDTKAAGDAMEVFGAKAGPKFAGLIRSGQLSYDQMLKSITGGGDSIRKAGKDTEDFSEKWTKIKNQVFVAIEPIAMRVFNAIGSLADKFSNLSPGVQQAIIVGAGFVAVLGGIGAAIAVLTPVVAAIGVAIGVLTSPITLVVAGIALLAFLFVKNFDTIKGAVENVLGWVREHWPLVVGILAGPIGLAVVYIATHFDSIVGFVKGMPGKIASAASGMWHGISDAFKTAINVIIRGWNALEFKIPGFNVGPAHFGGFTLGVPNIHPLAAGGVVRARPGGTLALLAEAGEDEVVAPLSKLAGVGGGGDLHVHFTGQALLTERDVENVIVQSLEAFFAHGGAIGNRRGAYLKPG